jgi:hypothetical protein
MPRRGARHGSSSRGGNRARGNNARKYRGVATPMVPGFTVKLSDRSNGDRQCPKCEYMIPLRKDGSLAAHYVHQGSRASAYPCPGEDTGTL